MKFLNIVLLVIMLGMVYFYNNNEFKSDKFLTWCYFFWNKSAIFLAITGYLFYEKDKRERRLIKCVALFLFVRVLWQIWEYSRPDIANLPVVLYALYFSSVIAMLVLLFTSNNKKGNGK